MVNNSLISVIVPVYNVEKYVDVCLESILNQTYSNIEELLNGSIELANQFGINNETEILPLEQRLINRNTDSAETIKMRLQNAKTELEQQNFYHHIIINENLEQAIQKIQDIIVKMQRS